MESIEFARYGHADPVALPLSLMQVGILFSLGPVVGSGNLGSAAASAVVAEQGFIVLCHVDLRRRRKQGEAVVFNSMSFMCNGSPAMFVPERTIDKMYISRSVGASV